MSVIICFLLAACGGERLVEPAGAAGAGDEQWHCRGSEAGGWYCSDDPGDPELLERQLEPVPAPAEARAPAAKPDPEAADSEPVTGDGKSAPQDGIMSGEPVAGATEPSDGTMAADSEAVQAPAADAAPGPVAEPASGEEADAAARLDPETDIFSLPADYFVLQLMADRQEQEIVAALERLALPEATYGRILSKGEVWYVLIAGIYPDREAAQQAQAQLDLSNLSVEPWIRSLGSLQNAIRRFQESGAQ